MLRWFLRRQVNAQEKQLGESMDYLRHIVDVSPAMMLRFASIMPFANSRKVLSADAWFVAQIVSAQQADCGPCLQITVNLAQQRKVSPALIRATIDGDTESLTPEMADVYRFAKSIVTHSYGEDELRETLRSRYGDRGLIEMSYAIAAATIPPTVKQVLGFAKSCSGVKIEVD